MASTPVILLLKRSGNSADRPSGTTIQTGEPALAFGAADPGFYFKDTAGSIRKIGPNHYATTAPNSSPVGLAGNSVGETWVDSSTTNYFLKVWTGSTWQTIGSAFATTADSADTANSALFANSAGTVVTATGVPCADIYTGTLTGTGPSGSLRYKTDATGSPSGLYVAYAGGWALV